MVRLLRHRQTKGAVTDRLNLRPPRHILTLPLAVVHSTFPWKTRMTAFRRNQSFDCAIRSGAVCKIGSRPSHLDATTESLWLKRMGRLLEKRGQGWQLQAHDQLRSERHSECQRNRRIEFRLSFDFLPENFKGIMELSASKPFVAITLRTLVNERGDFLITTFPVADLERTAQLPSSSLRPPEERASSPS